MNLRADFHNVTRIRNSHFFSRVSFDLEHATIHPTVRTIFVWFQSHPIFTEWIKLQNKFTHFLPPSAIFFSTTLVDFFSFFSAFSMIAFFCRNPFQWDWCAFWSAAYNLQCNLFPIGVGFTSFAFSLRCFCIQAAEMWPFNPSFFSSARLIAVSSIYFAFYFWMFQICLVYNGHRRTVAVKRFFPPVKCN